MFFFFFPQIPENICFTYVSRNSLLQLSSGKRKRTHFPPFPIFRWYFVPDSNWQNLSATKWRCYQFPNQALRGPTSGLQPTVNSPQVKSQYGNLGKWFNILASRRKSDPRQGNTLRRSSAWHRNRDGREQFPLWGRKTSSSEVSLQAWASSYQQKLSGHCQARADSHKSVYLQMKRWARSLYRERVSRWQQPSTAPLP